MHNYKSVHPAKNIWCCAAVYDLFYVNIHTSRDIQKDYVMVYSRTHAYIQAIKTLTVNDVCTRYFVSHHVGCDAHS